MSLWSSHLPAEPRLAAWLSAGGSLTAHIRRAGHDYRVKKLSQRCRSALPDEYAVLGRRRGVVVREILLMERDVPLVFAHSVVAQSHTAGPWRAIRGLGSRPLAELLFAEQKILRNPLRYRAVTRSDPLGQRIAEALPDGTFPLWARRSVFYKDGVPLMVTEVFLSTIAALTP